MGRRVLRVSPEVFLAFLKEQHGLPRTFTVRDPLPDDARVVQADVSLEWLLHGARRPEISDLELLIESDAWDEPAREPGERYHEVDPVPAVTVHVQPPTLLGLVADS